MRRLISCLLLILILTLTAYTAFMLGASWNAAKFDEKYRAIKKDIDWFYEGKCNEVRPSQKNTKKLKWGIKNG